MPIRTHYSRNNLITGEWNDVQTITYASLLRIDGKYFPARFSSAPVVNIYTPSITRDVIVFGDPGTTSFQCHLSKMGRIGVAVRADIEVIGDSVLKPTASSLVDIIGMMSIYLGDPGRGDFKAPIIVQMLNWAQENVVSILPPHILSDLDIILEEQVLDANGEFDVLELTDEIFHGVNGISKVRIHEGNFLRKMSDDEYAMATNLNKVFNASDYDPPPPFVIRGTKIRVLPYESNAEVESGDISEDVVYYVSEYAIVTYNGTDYADGDVFTGVSGVTTYSTTGTGTVILAQYIDLHYRRKPATMILYSNPALNVNCEFAEEIQQIIMGKALEDFQNNTPQAKNCVIRAIAKMEELILKYAPTDSLKDNIDDFTEGQRGLGSQTFHNFMTIYTP